MRASGPGARALADQVFRSRRPLRPRVATYGEMLGPAGDVLDRGLALFMPGPHSATGEDVLELHVHGSPVVARDVLRALFAAGARQAEAGEFTRRAFLAGKLDLSAAEAVADLIAAESTSAARAAAAHLGGALATEIAGLRARVDTLLEEVAASIDFPDEVPEPDWDVTMTTLEAIAAQVRALLETVEVGRLVREGVGVAIVGPPNAGKSSLLNALLGEERALVSETAGTTRDVIEETIVVDGIAVRLTDAAGLRTPGDAIEAAGVARARTQLATARLALVVVDGSQPLDSDARAVIAQTRDRSRVVLFNKRDLGSRGYDERQAPEERALLVSVRDRADVTRIRRALAEHLWGTAPDLERPHLATARHAGAAQRALAMLERAIATMANSQPIDFIVGDCMAASAALGEITGEAATEALIDAIFARFCIGK